MQQGVPKDIRLNLQDGTWISVEGTRRLLSKNVSIGFIVTSFGDARTGKARRHFYPDGSSTGGNIYIVRDTSTSASASIG